MAYLVLARKWRPQVFEDLVGQEPIARILQNAISHNKVGHAYIFSGPRGVGKTTTARILAKALNCEHGPAVQPCGKCPSCLAISDGSSVDVSEIDGASNTGVDNIRDLRERIRYAPSGSRNKVYIIDEAHMLSTSAFNALLKTLEEPPPHVIFVLATTDPKKIPATVLSRCQHLPFRRISGQKIKDRLKFISDSDGIKATDSALEMVARAADGSMRDSLTILDQIASFSEDITEAEVKDLLGITDVGTLSLLAEAIIEGDRKTILTAIAELTESGTDVKIFAKDMLQFIRDLLVVKIVGDSGEIVDLSEEEAAAALFLKDKTTEEHIALILSELIKAEPGIRSAFFPRIALEMTFIRLSLLSHFKSIDEALRTVQGHGSGPSESGPRTIQASPGQTLTGNYKRPLATVNPESPKPKVKASETAPANVPATVAAPGPASTKKYSSIADIWEDAMKKLDEANHPLACKLRDGQVSFGEKDIRISYNSDMSMHVDSVKESMSLINQTIQDLSGNKIPLKVDTAEAPAGSSKKDLREKALQNPILKEAMDLFEGRIVDVISIENKGGDNV